LLNLQDSNVAFLNLSLRARCSDIRPLCRLVPSPV
jgi:hypothetical protein